MSRRWNEQHDWSGRLTSSRSFTVERRPINGRGSAAKPDDLAEFRTVIATMRDVPREHVASMADVFHFLRRVTGKLSAIADRIEVSRVAEQPPKRVRLPRPGVDNRALAEGVFKLQPKRDVVRTITTRNGRRVRVEERSTAQLRLPL